MMTYISIILAILALASFYGCVAMAFILYDDNKKEK